MKKVLFAAFILVLCLTAFSVYAYIPPCNTDYYSTCTND